MFQDLTLVTKRGCPFAERVLIVLAWLEIQPRVVEVDVENKPDWFKTLSPLGKVPILIDQGHALFESTAINEYLVDRVGAETALIPADLLLRAQMRGWIQFDETALTPAFYRLLLAKPKDWDARRAAYVDRLKVLNSHLGGRGPYILGPAPSLADITIHTHLARLPLLVEHRFIDLSEGFTALETWRRKMASLPATQNAATPAAFMRLDLAPYIAAKAAGSTAQDMVGSSAR